MGFFFVIGPHVRTSAATLERWRIPYHGGKVEAPVVDGYSSWKRRSPKLGPASMRAAFRSARCWSIEVGSSDAATIDGCSAAARSSTARWTRSSRQGASPPPSTRDYDPLHHAFAVRDVQRRDLAYGIPRLIVGENRTFQGEEDPTVARRRRRRASGRDLHQSHDRLHPGTSSISGLPRV